jgi:hypothetical protein
MLLPLQVRQAEATVPSIKAIDGLMLHLLLSNPSYLCISEVRSICA